MFADLFGVSNLRGFVFPKLIPILAFVSSFKLDSPAGKSVNDQKRYENTPEYVCIYYYFITNIYFIDDRRCLNQKNNRLFKNIHTNLNLIYDILYRSKDKMQIGVSLLIST